MIGRERFYPSDTSDEEWDLIGPLLPVGGTGEFGGRPVKVPRRDIVDAILYVVRTGCSWNQLPKDFPKRSTVYHWFSKWTADGTLDAVYAALRDRVRALEGRDPQPSAGIIDAQAVRGSATVGAGERGYDGGKKINGRKRHVITDTLGLLLVVVVTAASVQDRDGARDTTEIAAALHPRLSWLWADRGYRGDYVSWAKREHGITVDIVVPNEGQKGFEVQPHRWIVERTLGWLIGHRRLTADHERTPAHSEAMCIWAMIGITARRIARTKPHHTVTPHNWRKK